MSRDIYVVIMRADLRILFPVLIHVTKTFLARKVSGETFFFHVIVLISRQSQAFNV